MHVVFGHVGQVVVHHLGQLADVDAPCGNVGGHQHLQLAALEFGQGAGAGILALVAVDGHGGDAVLRQLFGEPVGAVFGAGEHQDLEPLMGPDQVGEQLALAVTIHGMDHLAHGVRRGVARCHLDRLGRVQQPGRQRLDLVGKGRGKHQVLPLLRQPCEHLADVVDEAHVQHAVRFVQHQDFHCAQIQAALLHVIQQASRRGHQDVHAAAQALDLGLDAHASEHDHRGKSRVSAIGAHRGLHLGCKLPGWRENQGARPMARRVRVRGVEQALQDGQHETGGLTGSGLGRGEQIAAAEHGRNGADLDGSGCGVAVFRDGTHDGLGQAELGERHEDSRGSSACRRVTAPV